MQTINDRGKKNKRFKEHAKMLLSRFILVVHWKNAIVVVFVCPNTRCCVKLRVFLCVYFYRCCMILFCYVFVCRLSRIYRYLFTWKEQKKSFVLLFLFLHIFICIRKHVKHLCHKSSFKNERKMVEYQASLFFRLNYYEKGFLEAIFH